MGLAGLAGWARARVGLNGLGRAFGFGLGRMGEVFVFFNFSETISSAKTITLNSSKCLQGTKNIQKITKIPGKFLEID
jgi:hypothetical protein